MRGLLLSDPIYAQLKGSYKSITERIKALLAVEGKKSKASPDFMPSQKRKTLHFAEANLCHYNIDNFRQLQGSFQKKL